MRTVSVLTGLDVALRDGLSLPGKGRAAVLCNSTTVASSWVPTTLALARIPGVLLERILSPQHGFAAEKQDNMVASADGVHPRLGIPIVSLYGERREPRAEDLADIDALIIDLPDVGTRVYTFLVSAVLALRAARRCGVDVVILDRPNPIGGAIEGPVLRPGFESFVGNLDIPLRHGLTLGEGCLYGAWRAGLIQPPAVAHGHDFGWLRVVRLAGWTRDLYFDETTLPWTMPSPNMPALSTAIVYPGQVMLEGTNLSEGRGTTRPFEIFGAPWLDPAAVLRELAGRGWGPGEAGTPLAGMLLREVAYEPTFQRYKGQLARGFQIHVLDRHTYRPVHATVALLDAIRHTHEEFAWRQPPYEYEYTRMPIDLICGTDRVRQAIDGGAANAAGSPSAATRAVEDLLAGRPDEGESFRERARPFLLYD